MSLRVLNHRTDICQLCNFVRARQSVVRYPYRKPKAISTSRAFTTSQKLNRQSATIKSSFRTSAKLSKIQPKDSSAKSANPNRHFTGAELITQLKRAKDATDTLLSLPKAPSTSDIVSVLGFCKSVADGIADELVGPTVEKQNGAAASALLSLDELKNSRRQNITPPNPQIASELSNLAHSIVKHPHVFISPEVLEAYVDVQSKLSRPGTFPEVFHLYANKPLPQEGTSPIRYSRQNPNKSANAIPTIVANRALQAAIDTRQLGVAMDLIESTYTTKAFRRAKFIRKALVPSIGLTAAPFAAYVIASKLAASQTTMDTALATSLAFTGILAYVGFTTIIGVVAVTTANDQMDRVTWAPGIQLRERWMREEERAAIDKIAGAWGFRETWRRGEEEGEDWDALREWIGYKGMILDRVELMEGME
ncbi:hypothetical protein B7494_g3147 [Chlorociboria aeruginascens]|nr:hypothetical protein B7494_g3147 [Chlorociboria aeruginascens]